jgi:diamine N-acetyltransferase
VHALAEEARSRGFETLNAIWDPGEDGPEGFFTSIGFEITGETQYGERIGTLKL